MIIAMSSQTPQQRLHGFMLLSKINPTVTLFADFIAILVPVHVMRSKVLCLRGCCSSQTPH